MLEEWWRNSDNLILSNSICVSLTLKYPVCYNTTVALKKLPDQHPRISVISHFSIPLFSHLSSLYLCYDLNCVLYTVTCTSTERITGLISQLINRHKMSSSGRISWFFFVLCQCKLCIFEFKANWKYDTTTNMLMHICFEFSWNVTLACSVWGCIHFLVLTNVSLAPNVENWIDLDRVIERAMPALHHLSKALKFSHSCGAA